MKTIRNRVLSIAIVFAMVFCAAPVFDFFGAFTADAASFKNMYLGGL